MRLKTLGSKSVQAVPKGLWDAQEARRTLAIPRIHSGALSQSAGAGRGVAPPRAAQSSPENLMKNHKITFGILELD